MKFKQLALANAAAVWMGAVYLLCGLAIAALPGLSRAVMQSWFHGMDMSQMWTSSAFQGNFVLGLVTATGLTWVGTYLFAYLYNYFAGKK